MLKRADIRAMHVRTVLRHVYSLRKRGATASTNPLHVVIATNPAPPANVPDEEMDRYVRYHTSNTHGR